MSNAILEARCGLPWELLIRHQLFEWRACYCARTAAQWQPTQPSLDSFHSRRPSQAE
jgi:hypothetical protein